MTRPEPGQRARSAEDVVDEIEEAAGAGAKLVVFPETFIPAYPLWVWFIPPGHTHPLRELYSLLHANSVSVPGPAIGRLAEAAPPAREDAGSPPHRPKEARESANAKPLLWSTSCS